VFRLKTFSFPSHSNIFINNIYLPCPIRKYLNKLILNHDREVSALSGCSCFGGFGGFGHGLRRLLIFLLVIATIFVFAGVGFC
jgi:hypothetical protein